MFFNVPTRYFAEIIRFYVDLLFEVNDFKFL